MKTSVPPSISMAGELIKGHIEQSHELAAKAAKLMSISGVGARTAALLLAQLPELG